jgi:hypothetical protein
MTFYALRASISNGMPTRRSPHHPPRDSVTIVEPGSTRRWPHSDSQDLASRQRGIKESVYPRPVLGDDPGQLHQPRAKPPIDTEWEFVRRHLRNSPFEPRLLGSSPSQVQRARAPLLGTIHFCWEVTPCQRGEWFCGGRCIIPQAIKC